MLLTGFLGSGKTTLVNHVLSAAHGMRLGVLVNEFGALGVDGDLIVGTSGSVVELANGCICCATGEDLMRGLNELLGQSVGLDGVIIETSGLANPAPVADAIEHGTFHKPVRLAGIVTVVDALNFDENLERAEAAFHQLVTADLLLINKCDLVPAEVPAAIERGISRLNPKAPTTPCVMGRIPLELLFDVRRTGQREATVNHSAHDQAFESVSVWSPMPIDPVKFDAWLDALPMTVYRAKGFLHLHGRRGVVVFHLVGGRRSMETAPRSARTFSTLTLIGKHVSTFNLQDSFLECAVDYTTSK